MSRDLVGTPMMRRVHREAYLRYPHDDETREAFIEKCVRDHANGLDLGFDIAVDAPIRRPKPSVRLGINPDGSNSVLARMYAEKNAEHCDDCPHEDGLNLRVDDVKLSWYVWCKKKDKDCKGCRKIDLITGDCPIKKWSGAAARAQLTNAIPKDRKRPADVAGMVRKARENLHTLPVKGERMPVSVIIPYIRAHNDVEIRYCIRSIEKYLVADWRIFLVGDRPKWMPERLDDGRLVYIPAKRIGGPGVKPVTDWSRKVRLALEDERVGDTVVIWYDDNYLLQPTSVTDLRPPHSVGTRDAESVAKWREDFDKLPPENKKWWTKSRIITAERLTREGFKEVRDFETHALRVKDKTRLLEVIKRFEVDEPGTHLQLHTLYHNLHPEDGEPFNPAEFLRFGPENLDAWDSEDDSRKQSRIAQAESVIARMSKCRAMNHSGGWSQHMEPVLKALFPEPSFAESEPPPRITSSERYEATVLTPTGDRPQAFELCRRMMARQTARSRVKWIVSNDGKSEMSVPEADLYLRNTKRPNLAGQIINAIPHVEGKGLLVVEDDDWYPADYVEKMVPLFDRASLVSFSHRTAYHPQLRRFMWTKPQRGFAVLANTGVRVDALDHLKAMCEEDNWGIDQRLWVRYSGAKLHVNIREPKDGVIQMRGMPGRPNMTQRIVKGKLNRGVGRDDPDLDWLRSQIGADSWWYAGFWKENKAAPVKTFKHSGCAGDIIYSLPAVCGLGGGHLYLNTKMPSTYRAEHRHPDGKVMLGERTAALLRPLLECQPYVTSTSIHDGEEFDHDLDRFRSSGLRYDRVSLADHYLHLFRDADVDISRPWLHVEPNRSYADAVIVNRTHRYRNLPSESYSALSSFGRLVFIGLDDEYDDMAQVLPGIERYVPENFLEAARAIAACKLYVGNQSLMYAMAEGLKVRRVLEAYPKAPNCMPIGGQGRQCFFQEEFRAWLEKMAA